MSEEGAIIDALVIAGQALWFMFPAMTTGSFAVLFGGGRPVDGGRKDGKGRRLLGNGKTWSGLGWGILGGVAVGCLMVMILYQAGEVAMDHLTDFRPEDPSMLGFIGPLFAMCFGSMMGDIVFSFAKRRIGLKRGARTPLVDQLDFLVGSWVFLLLFYPHFTLDTFSSWHAVAILITVPLIHFISNLIAYKLGKKKEPW